MTTEEREMYEFGIFQATIFASWGFNKMTDVIHKKITYKQYIHDMLLFIMGHFQEPDKAHRFLQTLDDKTLRACEDYIVENHKYCVEVGIIEEPILFKKGTKVKCVKALKKQTDYLQYNFQQGGLYDVVEDNIVRDRWGHLWDLNKQTNKFINQHFTTNK